VSLRQDLFVPHCGEPFKQGGESYGNRVGHNEDKEEAGTPFPVSEANEVGKGAGG